MKMLLVLLSFTAVSALAADLSSLCEKEARSFGDGSGKDSISKDCEAHVRASSTGHLQARGTLSGISVTGHGNIIFVEDPKSKIKGQNLIAGKYTELDDLRALALDDEHREIVALTGNGDVLFFSAVLTGNVAPRRILRHKELDGAISLALNPQQEELLVLNPKKSEVLVFSRKGNVDAPEGKKHLSVLKIFRGVKGEFLLVDDQGVELFVIAPRTGVLTVVDLRTNAIREEIKFPKVTDLKEIVYVPSSKAVELTTSSKVLKVPIPQAIAPTPSPN
jgi:hypothetical protein